MLRVGNVSRGRRRRQRRPCSPAAAGLVDGAPRQLMDQFGLSKASFFFSAVLPVQIRTDAKESKDSHGAVTSHCQKPGSFSHPATTTGCTAHNTTAQQHTDRDAAKLRPVRGYAPPPERDRGGLKSRTRECLDERSSAEGEDPQLLLLYFNFGVSLNIWPEPPARPGPTAASRQTDRGLVWLTRSVSV